MKYCLAIWLLPLAAVAADTNALPALSPAYGEMPQTFWDQHGTATLVGGFILLTLAAIVLRQFLKPNPQLVLPPETIAREALAQLQRRPEDGKVLSEISQILRRYVSLAFQFPSGELTTAEFSAALAGNEKIGAELAQMISGFLRECDERKFSPAVRSSAYAQPGSSEGGTLNLLPPLNAASRALDLISLTEKVRGRRDACPAIT